jgi:F420-dependent oxidoreductase-like protein
MKLGIETRYQDAKLVLPMERIRHVEKIGYDAVFVPEGHGADCFGPLGYIAANTNRIKLGTRITQIAARSPPAAAMAFQTIDQLTGGGRVMAGLGSSERTTVEGWHGRAWGSPYWRMREYVEIMRQASRSTSQTVDFHGREYSIPYAGPNSMPAPPKRSYLDTNPDIPIIIGCGNPAMIRLTAEIADGWFPLGFRPGMMKDYAPLLEAGFAKAGNGKSLRDFDIWVQADVMVDNDVRTAMAVFKRYVARWAKLTREQMVVRGYADLADRIIELQAAGRNDEAVAAVPDEYIDEGWLVGPLPRIAERFKPWLDSGVSGVIIRHGDPLKFANPPENLDIYTTIAKAAGK